MNRILGLALLVIIILILGGAVFYMKFKPSGIPGSNATTQAISPLPKDTRPPEEIAKVAQESIQENLDTVFILTPQSNSNQAGSIEIKDVNGKAQVTLILTQANDIPQPAHIHSGSCPKPGEVAYPLTNVVNGRSVTTLTVPVSELKQKLPLAINIHKSEKEASVYVSCANLWEKPSVSPTTVSSPLPTQ